MYQQLTLRLYKLKRGENMKKIAIVIGTNHEKQRSDTWKVVQVLMDSIRDINSQIEINPIFLSELKSEYCKGCLSCFLTGKCPLDKQDDIGRIKEQLVEADHIIFAAPVYVHNVPASLKNLIDRLGYWTHIFRLLGKTSTAIIVTSTNGHYFVTDYLTKVLKQLGTYLINSIEVTIDYPAMLANPKLFKKQMDKQAELILNFDIKDIETEKIKESNKSFGAYKRNLLNAAGKEGAEDSFEYNYWKQNGMLEQDGFYEAFQYCASKEKC